jgi:hypothetical protein
VKAATRTILFISVLLTAFCLGASDKDKDKDKDKKTAKVVDSGSFGIFLNGKRVGTETFNIEQRADFSIATSQIKVDDGSVKADQTMEMQVSPKGELVSYSWRATVPQKEESTVEPKDQLLVEHITPADQKKQDVPHVLPLSTVILDDNFFSQRELLVWRYLATGCLWKKGEAPVCGPSHFGTLVPHQHTAGEAVMEFIGIEKLTIKGVEHDFNKIKLDSDGVLWMLWVSDDYKVIKMAVAANNVEVVRD